MLDEENKLIVIKGIYKFNKAANDLSKVFDKYRSENIIDDNFDIDNKIQYYSKVMENFQVTLKMAIEIAQEDKDFYILVLKYVSNLYKLTSMAYEYKHNIKDISDEDIDFLINSLQKASDAFEQISLQVLDEKGGIRIDWVVE